MASDETMRPDCNWIWGYHVKLRLPSTFRLASCWQVPVLECQCLLMRTIWLNLLFFRHFQFPQTWDCSIAKINHVPPKHLLSYPEPERDKRPSAISPGWNWSGQRTTVSSHSSISSIDPSALWRNRADTWHRGWWEQTLGSVLIGQLSPVTLCCLSWKRGSSA